MIDSKYPEFPLLLVDDEVKTLQSYELLLNSGGIDNVILCEDSREVVGILSEQDIGVILLDLAMPHLSGEQLLPQIVKDHPEIPVIILTGANNVETAVGCMKAGATDYMVKPVEESQLVSSLRRAVELRELRLENVKLTRRLQSDKLEHPEVFADIVTVSPKMRSIFQYIEAVADSSKPLLITGETGVGKELIAKAVHALSGRAGSFVTVNAAGLDDNVFSDTLFGHERGAFTGADQVRNGLIETAVGGTLFLDEIGDLSPASQVRLLRVIQEREYFPIGSDIPKLTDARIVTATNQTLDDLRDSGGFRRDLFYRLHTHHVHVPPLRERKNDLPLLVDYFLEEVSTSVGKKKPTPPAELFTLLATYDFPGNIRELESMVYDAVSNHTSRMLALETFKSRIQSGRAGQKGNGESILGGSEPFLASIESLPTLKEAAKVVITEAMRRTNGNQTIAAQLLGISQSALSRRLKQLDL